MDNAQPRGLGSWRGGRSTCACMLRVLMGGAALGPGRASAAQALLEAPCSPSLQVWLDLPFFAGAVGGSRSPAKPACAGQQEGDAVRRRARACLISQWLGRDPGWSRQQPH